MHQYENTRFLAPYLEPHGDEIKRRLAESGGGEGDVKATADVLHELVTNDSEINAAMVEAFWASVDWRLLADMYLGLDQGTSI